VTDSSQIDWRKTTFDGAEVEQMKAFRGLSLREKLLIVEEMADRARFVLNQRRNRGLAYFDPLTGDMIRANRVAESNQTYGVTGEIKLPKMAQPNLPMSLPGQQDLDLFSESGGLDPRVPLSLRMDGMTFSSVEIENCCVVDEVRDSGQSGA
jgi:hypothetical protein